jgi:hypothetical protein
MNNSALIQAAQEVLRQLDDAWPEGPKASSMEELRVAVAQAKLPERGKEMMSRVEYEQAVSMEAMGMFTLIIGFGPDEKDIPGITPEVAAEMAVEKYKASAKLATQIAFFAAEEFQKRIGECPGWV